MFLQAYAKRLVHNAFEIISKFSFAKQMMHGDLKGLALLQLCAKSFYNKF